MCARPVPYGAGAGMCGSSVQILGRRGSTARRRLLDRQAALHPGGLVAVHVAEEGVLARLQVAEVEGGRAAGDDVRTSKLVAARAVDAYVVRDGLVRVVEVDRHVPRLGRERICGVGDLTRIRRELDGRTACP